MKKNLENVTTKTMDVLANVTTDIAPIELSSVKPVVKKIEKIIYLKMY